MIHSTSIVHKNAELDSNVVVGPYSIIGEHVKIRSGTVIGSHVTIDGWTEIGENNKVFQFVSLGSPPQHIKYKGEETYLKIGNNNIIREYVTMNIGTKIGDGITTVGNNNIFMMYSHIAHDCHIGDYVIFANNATLAGHVIIEGCVILGGLSAVHQFVKIGEYALISGGSMVTQDVPPYTIVQGDRARLYGLNIVGLTRRGISKESIDSLKKAYKIIFRSGLPLKQALEDVKASINNSLQVEHLVNFLQESKRGVCR